MPSYISKPQSSQVSAIYPGNSIALVNDASTDTGITKTLQLAIGPVPGNSTATLSIYNSTNQQATGNWAATETLYGSSASSPTYEPLNGCIIPAGATLPYNLSGGWICFTFSPAPTNGSLIVSR
ncbi:MAG TPA: hypothetical protein VMC85_20830 [Desulfomonilaceae bacterium]|nr:hypothetical protein [Desulfomonilaceae bacterium]